MNIQIRSKLPDVGITIFTVMSRLALEYGAINLSQGFPDFDVDQELFELVDKHMRLGNNQYAPMQGVMDLRERISEKNLKLYGASNSPTDEITITSGATEALYAAITSVVNKGDEVIIFEPAYDSYVPTVELSGGKPVYCRLRHPDYSIDWEMVKRSLTRKTRLMILNSPHNPTGSVLSEGDIAALKDLISDTDIFIVSDEVYEHIIFDDGIHQSMLRHPELAARSFVIGSFGKTYHATGWKVGYCIAPSNLTSEFRKIHQYLTFATNTPVQYALAEYMKREDRYLEVSNFYQKKRDMFLSLIKGSRFGFKPSKGPYFQLLDYSKVTGETDEQYAKKMTTDHGVASIPPSVFYHDNIDNRVLRFCFAKKDETLEMAAERLCGI